MHIAVVAHHGLILAFVALALWAAICDLRSYSIPNRISVYIVCAFGGYALLGLMGGASVSAVLWHFALAGAVFGIGALLFAVGGLGGGDVKLLAASALWAGPSNVSLLLIVMGLAGALLSAAYLALPERAPLAEGPVSADVPLRVRLKRQVPYGVAIAAGCLAVAARLI
jgi:prepilin peptidase CpaA